MLNANASMLINSIVNNIARARIVEWKNEEEEIGKDKYPLYEAIKIIIPNMEKEQSTAFINKLLTHLSNKNLLFKDWQSQRDIRRKVRAETRLMLLGEFKDYKGKIDDLTEGVFTALEGIDYGNSNHSWQGLSDHRRENQQGHCSDQ